ncbi:MAG TPA: response regulator [Smithellaceae bacterium]|nr:response regulator [Smithellaceae bacterium]HRS88828.1 response regulator [Smithellaceae bacterium]HRV25736.1 response regulator [Smithellaceae bacterium]
MNVPQTEPLKHRHSILIVDDEESILNAFRRILADEDYDIHTASDGKEGLAKLRNAQKPFSLIISDQRMPVMNGVQFFAAAKEIFPDAVRILLTGYADTDAIIDAINKGGIHLYFTKPWREEELLAHIKQSLYKSELLMENRRLVELIKRQNEELLNLNKTLEEKVRQKTSDLLAKAEELKASYERSQVILDGTVKTMSKIVETRDPYTSGHEVMVAKISCRIAREMGLPEQKIEAIHIAATLHDIGKISVPSEILTKPGRLTDLEMEIIKTHCRVAYDILKTIDFPYPVADIILQHHERIDGSGYPLGLKGENILLEARIIATADVIEAMASHRPYRPALGVDVAMEEIIKFKGSLYDSDVVDACLRIYKTEGKKAFLQEENSLSAARQSSAVEM